jgi:hypothetical protein
LEANAGMEHGCAFKFSTHKLEIVAGLDRTVAARVARYKEKSLDW